MRKLTEEEKGNKPPLNRRRIVVQIVVGSIVVIAVQVILRLRMGSYSYGHFGAGIWAGHIISSVVGIPIAVYVVGNIGKETGSVLFTWLGSIAGCVAAPFLALPLSMILSPLGMDTEIGFARVYYLVFLVILSGPIVGATIGFNKTRRYKSPHHRKVE